MHLLRRSEGKATPGRAGRGPGRRRWRWPTQSRGDPTCLPTARPEGPSVLRLSRRAALSVRGPSQARRGLEVARHPPTPTATGRGWGAQAAPGASDSPRGPCQAGLVDSAGTSRSDRQAQPSGLGEGRGGPALTWLQLAGLASCRRASPTQCPPPTPPLLPLVPATAACKMAPRRGGPGAGSREAARPRARLGPTSLPAPDPSPPSSPRRERLPPQPGTRRQASRISRPHHLPPGSLSAPHHVSFISLPWVEVAHPPCAPYHRTCSWRSTWNAERSPEVSPSLRPLFTLPESELCQRLVKIIKQFAGHWAK